MVGVPMNAIFDWPMGTSSGHNFFLDADVNACLKKVLNAWGKFLMVRSLRIALHIYHYFTANTDIPLHRAPNQPKFLETIRTAGSAQQRPQTSKPSPTVP
jgi:hypothetical protein